MVFDGRRRELTDEDILRIARNQGKFTVHKKMFKHGRTRANARKLCEEGKLERVPAAEHRLTGMDVYRLPKILQND